MRSSAGLVPIAKLSAPCWLIAASIAFRIRRFLRFCTATALSTTLWIPPARTPKPPACLSLSFPTPKPSARCSGFRASLLLATARAASRLPRHPLSRPSPPPSSHSFPDRRVAGSSPRPPRALFCRRLKALSLLRRAARTPQAKGLLAPAALPPSPAPSTAFQSRALCNLDFGQTEHIGRHTVPPEWGAHLHALDHRPCLREHLLRDLHALGTGRLGTGHCRHPRHDSLRHADAQIVLHELGVAQTGQWPDSCNHRNPETFNPPQELLQHPQIEDGLGDGKLRACLYLEGEPADLLVHVLHAGVRRDGDGETCRFADGVLADVEPVVQVVNDVHQADRVDIEYRRCVWIVAQLRRVSGEAENVLQPNRRRAQQITLNTQHIPVPAGVMQNRLDSHVLLDLHTQALRAHPCAGTRGVRHIDCIHSQPVQHLRAINLLCAVDALGRDNLHHGDELVGRHHRPNLRPLGERRRIYLARGLDCRLTRIRTPQLHDLDAALHRFERPQRTLHRPRVAGSGPAAPADNACSRLDQLARKAGHVLRRGEIDRPALHRPWNPCIRHRGQRLVGHGTHPFDHTQHGRRSRAAVASHSIRAPLRQLDRRGLRRRAIETVSLFIDGHHHHHGDLRGDTPGRQNRLLRLSQRSHRLDRQQIGSDSWPALHQGANLLRKRGPRLIEANLAQRLQPHPQWPDRCGDKGLAGLLLANLIHALPRQSDAGHVDLTHLILQTVHLETKRVSAEGVGFDHLGTRLQILRMDLAYQLRLRQVQLVIAAVDEDAPRIQHRAHRAIAQHGTSGKQPADCGISRNGTHLRIVQRIRHDHLQLLTLILSHHPDTFQTRRNQSLPPLDSTTSAPSPPRVLCYTQH